ncbi:MAG: hypothetical protein U9Q81_00320 [Pseudomonadota bacterium]|nr:hypothetical protein [Pseudomonadota bacterium]
MTNRQALIAELRGGIGVENPHALALAVQRLGAAAISDEGLAAMAEIQRAVVPALTDERAILDGD